MKIDRDRFQRPERDQRLVDHGRGALGRLDQGGLVVLKREAQGLTLELLDRRDLDLGGDVLEGLEEDVGGDHCLEGR